MRTGGMRAHERYRCRTQDYMDKVNTDHSQLKDVPSMSMSDLFALVTLVGMDRSKHQHLHKANQELVADIDAGNAVSLEKVLQIGFKHDRRSSRPVTVLAALRLDCSCNLKTGHTCPNCVNLWPDSRDNTPRSARSSSTRSPLPRGLKTQLTRDLDEKYKDDVLKPRSKPKYSRS